MKEEWNQLLAEEPCQARCDDIIDRILSDWWKGARELRIFSAMIEHIIVNRTRWNPTMAQKVNDPRPHVDSRSLLRNKIPARLRHTWTGEYAQELLIPD